MINLVHGRGEVVGKALAADPRVPVISFTGSTVTGSQIGETCGRMHKRLSLEMGGKNAMIVLDDADLDPGARGSPLGCVRHCGATLHRHQPAAAPSTDSRPLPGSARYPGPPV